VQAQFYSRLFSKRGCELSLLQVNRWTNIRYWFSTREFYV